MTRRPLLVPIQTTQTTIYVWGRGRPRAPITQLPFRYTEVARCFAAQRGCIEWGRDAWACEIELPLGLSDVLAEFEPVFWRDPAVKGWALRTVRSALSLPDLEHG